ncbi:MAG: hypothetical protein Q8Q11_00025 [bacterium]|nr:hypothetical protein [bacterium]MDZ4247884.1 hypothetical protein [Patescibacteria group bacterium]
MGDFLGLFMLLAGYVIGLGAVTVIDLHGILSRRSSYWTETTARTHKVTRPLIWLGVGLVIIGAAIFYRGDYGAFIPTVHAALLALLVLNGLFVSFRVTPFLLVRESEGRASELLPDALQHKIAVAFAVSTIAWWGSLALLVWYVLGR